MNCSTMKSTNEIPQETMMSYDVTIYIPFFGLSDDLLPSLVHLRDFLLHARGWRHAVDT